MENTTTKITKRDVLLAVKALAEDGNMHIEDFNAELTDAAVIEYCDKELENLEKKAERARAANLKKREAGDEITEAIKGVLTDEFQTIPVITAKVGMEDVTVSKVSARLTNLVKFGYAQKQEVSVKDEEGGRSRRVQAYALVSTDTAEA